MDESHWSYKTLNQINRPISYRAAVILSVATASAFAVGLGLYEHRAHKAQTSKPAQTLERIAEAQYAPAKPAQPYRMNGRQ